MTRRLASLPNLTRRATLMAAALAILPGRTHAADPVTDLSRADVRAGLADNSLLLVDVREPDEFAAGHIPGAVNLPLKSFDPARLPKVAGKRVVLYCRSGHRARLALDKAQAAGRSDVTAIYGGSMNDWQAAGEPIEK